MASRTLTIAGAGALTMAFVAAVTRPRAVGRLVRNLVTRAADSPNYVPLPPPKKVIHVAHFRGHLKHIAKRRRPALFCCHAPIGHHRRSRKPYHALQPTRALNAGVRTPDKHISTLCVHDTNLIPTLVATQRPSRGLSCGLSRCLDRLASMKPAP